VRQKQALNINADTVAGEIAAGLNAEKLILMTGKRIFHMRDTFVTSRAATPLMRYTFVTLSELATPLA
jgi:acetylglutamate kinase